MTVHLHLHDWPCTAITWDTSKLCSPHLTSWHLLPPYTGRGTEQTAEGPGTAWEDLVHCTRVIMLNPVQVRCAEERNETRRICFLLAIGVRPHRFILRHLFLMVFCKSPIAMLWTSLKKYCQTSHSHSQLHSLPALTSPVVGRLHQWGRFSGNYVSQPSSLYSCVVLRLISADVLYELFSWELSIDVFTCSFQFSSFNTPWLQVQLRLSHTQCLFFFWKWAVKQLKEKLKSLFGEQQPEYL